MAQSENKNLALEKKVDELSKRVTVLIALSFRQLTGNKEFSQDDKRKQGVGDVARYLSNMGLEAKEIAGITGAPLSSIRTLLTPKRQK